MSLLLQSRCIRNICGNPSQSLRCGIVLAIAGIALFLAGYFGPRNLFAFRFVAVVPIIFSYVSFRAYCRNRHRRPSNHHGARVNTAMDTQAVQQSTAAVTPAPPPYVTSVQPYPPTEGTQYGFSGLQNQVNQSDLNISAGNDPSMPPPYDMVASPAGQHESTDLPPPPSYDEVMRESR